MLKQFLNCQPFTFVANLFFTCKNLYFVNDEDRTGCPKLGHTTLCTLIKLSCNWYLLFSSLRIIISNIAKKNLVFEKLQCDAIRWEQFKKLPFSRGYNFWTNDLILILKTSTRSYSCLAKDVVRSKLGLNVWFVSYRLKKGVDFRTVPIWLHHTVAN